MANPRPYLETGLRKLVPQAYGPVDAGSLQNRILIGIVVSLGEVDGVWTLVLRVQGHPNARQSAVYELLHDFGWPFLCIDGSAGKETLSIARERVFLVAGSSTDIRIEAIGRGAEGTGQQILASSDPVYLLPVGEGLNSRMLRTLEAGFQRLRDQADLLVGMMDPRTTDARFLIPLFQTLVSSNAFLFIVLLLIPAHRLRLLLEAVVPFIKGKWTTDGLEEVFLFFTGMRMGLLNYWKMNWRLGTDEDPDWGEEPPTLGRKSMLPYDNFMDAQISFRVRYHNQVKGYASETIAASGFTPDWFSTDPDHSIDLVQGREKELLTPWVTRFYLPIHPLEGLMGYMAFLLFQSPFAQANVLEPVYLYDDFSIDLRDAFSGGYYFDSALTTSEVASVSNGNLDLEVTGALFTTDSNPVGRRVRLSSVGGFVSLSEEWTIVERLSDMEVRLDRPLDGTWVAGAVVEYVSFAALAEDDKSAYLSIDTSGEPVAIRLMRGWSISPRMVARVEVYGEGFAFVFIPIGSADIFIFAFSPKTQGAVLGLQRGDTFYALQFVDLGAQGLNFREEKERLLSARLGKVSNADLCRGYWQLLPYSINLGEGDFLPSGVIPTGLVLGWNGQYWEAFPETPTVAGTLSWVSALGEVPLRSDDNPYDREWQDFLYGAPTDAGTVFGWWYFLPSPVGVGARTATCLEVRVDWDGNRVSILRYNDPAAPTVLGSIDLATLGVRLKVGVPRNINSHVETFFSEGVWTNRFLVAIDHDIVLSVTETQADANPLARGAAYSLFLEAGRLAIMAYCTATPMTDFSSKTIIPYWDKGWVLGETPLGSITLRNRQPGAEVGMSIDHDRVLTGRIPGWPVGHAGIAALRFDLPAGTMAKVREWRVHADLGVTDIGWRE